MLFFNCLKWLKSANRRCPKLKIMGGITNKASNHPGYKFISRDNINLWDDYLLLGYKRTKFEITNCAFMMMLICICFLMRI